MSTFKNPADYVMTDKTVSKMLEESNNVKTKDILDRMFDDRGIIVDKNGKAAIDPNKFIRYALSRCTARENAMGIWFYNYTTKQYDLLSEAQYKKIFFYIIEEASEDVWKPSMERLYIEYFKNKVEQIDKTGYEFGYIQLNNCILDFHDEENIDPVEASPEYFCNFRLPYNYDENAECPQFMDFLNDVFEEDQERIHLVQEIMGACLCYNKCMQYLVVFLGNGSNGKSLLASIIKHMLGDSNVSAIPLDRLSGNQFSKQNLDGKLLNISSEIKSEKIYSTSDLKTLTGGDAVEVEKKFKDAYTTEIYSKFIVLANEMFQTDDTSDGFYRRLMIIPFNQQYFKLNPNEEPDEDKKYQDIELEKKLVKELSGIFNFALEGLCRLSGNGYHFSFCTESEKAKERYKNENNVIKAFMNECIDVVGTDTKERIKSSELFPKFEKFCKSNHFNRQYNSTTKFKFFKLFDALIDTENLDAVKRKRRNAYYYIGMKFKEETK